MVVNFRDDEVFLEDDTVYVDSMDVDVPKPVVKSELAPPDQLYDASSRNRDKFKEMQKLTSTNQPLDLVWEKLGVNINLLSYEEGVCVGCGIV